MGVLQRVLLAGLTLFGIVGCYEIESPSSVRQTGFIYCGQESPITFNPQLVNGGLLVDTLSAQLFNRLLRIDPITHKPLPELATQWTISPDGLEYIFDLRTNVSFYSNDLFAPTRPLSAKDVVFSFQRIIDKTHPYHAISGEKYPWFESLGFSLLIDRIEAIAPLQVKFVLQRPDNSFLANLASSYAIITSQEYAEFLLRSGRPSDLDHLPIGTGPFSLTKFVKNEEIRLSHHKEYWQDVPKMEQIVFDISNRGAGQLAKLISKECDVLSAPIASQLPIMDTHPELQIQSQTGMNVSFLALNQDSPYLKNKQLRQAIRYAINQEKLLNAVYYGTGQAANSVLPPTSWASTPYTSTASVFNPLKAQQLLLEAGITKRIPLRLWVSLDSRPYNPSPKKTAELIQSNLRAVGIDVQIYHHENSDPIETKNLSQFDLILTGWIADNGDPDSFLRPILSCDAKQAGLNFANWCHLPFDNLLELALRMPNQAQRLTYYQLAQEILYDEVPIIPLAHGMQYQIHHRSLQGLTLNPFGNAPFTHVYRHE